MKIRLAAAVTLTLISMPARTQDRLPDPPFPEGEHVAFRDGSQCYYRNHFFDIDQQTTATVALSSAGVFPEPRLVDRYGAHEQQAGGPPGLYIFKADCGPTQGFGALDIPNPAGKTQVPIILDNTPPVLRSLAAEVNGSAVSGAPRNSVVTLSANATDPDGDALTFTWGVNAGTIVSTSGATAQWRLPDSPGLAFAYVLVTDGKGAFREGSTTVSTDGGIVPAVAAVAPPATPSDKVNAPDHFLTFHSTKDLELFPTRGADSRKGSCEYYAAIGAVEGCSAAGKMLGEQLTFAAWKAKWGFTSDSAGFRATYANIRDLDLERDMHGLTNAQGTAYYVCNYPHVRGGQPDTGLLNVQRGENLVACVAMEHSPTAGVSEGRPFTKFFVFAPGGQLLQSVNLDGRGEKYLPGSCTVCHGAQTSFVRFDESGSTSPDFGAHFLPFDLDNFAYATASGPLSRSAQEAQFRNLNRTILATNPRPAIRELIDLWYPDPNSSNFTPAVPPGWAGHEGLYTAVVQKYCRTCHVAMHATQSVDFAFQTFTQFNDERFNVARRACGLNTGVRRKRWSMPNAKVTFDQFWNDGAAIAALQQYLVEAGQLAPGEICVLQP